MYAREYRRAMRAGVSRGRRAWPVLVALGVATMACSTAMGQDPAIFGKWDIPKGAHGYDWDEVLDTDHAVHLSTGQILVWDHPPFIAPQLWNPDDGSFTPVAYSLHKINCSGHVGLADGSILVAGGFGETGGSATNKTSIFGSVLSGSPWTPTGDMAYARWYPTCTTLRDGRVLIVAGSDLAGGGCAVTTPEIYDPAAGTWSTLPFELTPEITRWYPRMFVVPDGNKVFFAGGDGGDGCGPGCTLGCDSFILDLDGDPETWVYVADNPGGGGSAVIYQTEPGPLGRVEVLRAGGGSGNVNTKIIDVTLFPSSWEDQLPMLHKRARHNLVLLPDGTILAVGGRNSDDGAVFDAELFDPNDPIVPHWSLMASSEYPHTLHSTAVLLADGTVLAAGGDDPPAGKAEVFSPPYLFLPGGGAAPRPLIGFAATVVTYGSSFSVILSSRSLVPPEAIAKVSFVRLAAVTHSFDQNQRYVPLAFDLGPAPSSDQFSTLIVQAPADGSYAPPGYYMLFVVSDAGVPSIAKYVRLYGPVAI